MPRASTSSAERARAAEQLRADMSALNQEMAESTQALADIEARAATAEGRAMKAIHASDDCAARVALLEQLSYVEKAATLAADLKVLRAILDECHRFASELSESAPSEPLV